MRTLRPLTPNSGPNFWDGRYLGAVMESALRSRRLTSKELGHVIMCAYGAPRAGIFIGRVLRDTPSRAQCLTCSSWGRSSARRSGPPLSQGGGPMEGPEMITLTLCSTLRWVHQPRNGSPQGQSGPRSGGGSPVSVAVSATAFRCSRAGGWSREGRHGRLSATGPRTTRQSCNAR